MFGLKKQIIPEQYDDTFKKIVQRMQEENEFTPDIASLDMYHKHLLFVVDELKSTFKDEGTLLCSAFTQKNFEFVQSVANPWMSPIPLMGKGMDEKYFAKSIPSSLKIKGEIHAVSSKVLKNLDIERQNGIKFLRQRVRIVIPYRELRRFPTHDVFNRELPKVLQGKEDQFFLSEEKIHLARPWMYIGNPDVWEQFIDAGYNFEQVKTFEVKDNRKWMKRYYNFYKQDS